MARRQRSVLVLAGIALPVFGAAALWLIPGSDPQPPSAVGKGATMSTPTTSAAQPRPMTFSLPLPDLGRYRGPHYPENMPLAGVLGAAMDLLNDDLGLDWEQPPRHTGVDSVHTFFMGVAGEAFTFNWFAREGQHPEESRLDPTLYWPDPATPYRRAMAAAGYTCEVLVRPGLTGPQRGSIDGPAVKQQIVACIADKGLPAIVVGVPKPNDFLLVTGYEDAGDTLTGWFSRGGGAEIHFAPDKMVRVTDWAARADLVVLLTAMQKRPAEEQAVRAALLQAEQLLRLREFGPFHAGPATFDVWADDLLADDPPPVGWGDDERPTREARRRFLICPSTWDLMERASYASFFLHRAAVLFPSAANELTAAEQNMGEISGAMLEACKLTGWDPGHPLPEAEQDKLLADPEVRRQAADVIRGCRAEWLEAADHVRSALAHTD